MGVSSDGAEYGHHDYDPAEHGDRYPHTSISLYHYP